MPISPRASAIGLPTLRASSTARSSCRSASASASPCEQPRPVGRRHRPPRRVRRAGARHGLVRVRRVGARQLRQDLLGRRLDDGQGQAGVALGGSVGSTGSSSTMPAASSHSIVRTGPLNVFFALTSHQMPTMMNMPPTISGA